MDVAVVHPFLYTKGGAERVVLRIARAFDATVYVSRYAPEKTFSEFSDIDVRVLPGKLRWLVPPFFPRRVRDAVVAGHQFYSTRLPGDFDVVNAQGTPSQWIRHRNEPVVWYCHTPNREAFDLYDWRMKRRNVLQRLFYWSAIQPYRVIEPRVVPDIEHIFANSRNTQERISRYLGVDSEILSPGVDYEDFYCSGFDKFFFYPSRITPEKRFEYAIEAFGKFNKTHPDWRLVIAGALVRERGEHVTYYERLKRMLGSDGDILVDVPWSRLRELYATCSGVVYTPVNEDFGIIPLEAAASAKPVIAVNEGGPREVVVQERTGFLVDSVAELAERMGYLADHRGEAEKMGEEGRRRVKERYSWERFLGRFGQVLKEAAKA